MMLTLKEMAVVLAFSFIVFALMKPVLAPFVDDADYSRRRNLWLLVSAAGFITPNFWVFVLLAAPLIFWKAKADRNPASLYFLLMFVIPSIPVPVPMIGMQSLFSMDIFMLLSFVLMIPSLLRRRSGDAVENSKKWLFIDFLVAMYGVILAFFYVHAQTEGWGVYPSTLTESLRRAIVFAISVFFPYLVIRRTCSNQRAVTEMLAMFCLACVLLAVLGMFESSRHWLLYGEFASHWGIYNAPTEYLMRERACERW